MKAVLHSSKESGEKAERAHVPLLLAVGVLVVLAFVFGFAIHFNEYVVVVGVALAAAVVFVYGICFESYYWIYKEEFVRGEKAAAERDIAVAEKDAALARLRPKLEIMTEAEIEPIQNSCRIRVQSRCDVGCKFGAEIVRITPEISGFPLPFALRLIPETGSRTEFLPAGLSRTVDVVMLGADFDKATTFDDTRLVFLGIGDSGFILKTREGEQCVITIHAYCDLEVQWADLRNNAAHGNTTAYTSNDVDAFLRDVSDFCANMT
jgi:hypothetical protein